MTDQHFKILASEINEEEKTLHALVQEGMAYYRKNIDEDLFFEGNFHKLRVYGSILHDFYTCIEKIFRKIALEMDCELPNGSSWHRELLSRMKLNINEIRIQVIDAELEDILSEYLGFRQVFRNIYGFDLKWEKIQPLILQMEQTEEKLKNALHLFIDFILKIKLN